MLTNKVAQTTVLLVVTEGRCGMGKGSVVVLVLVVVLTNRVGVVVVEVGIAVASSPVTPSVLLVHETSLTSTAGSSPWRASRGKRL